MTQSIAARLASIRAAIQAIGTDVGNLQQQSRAWKIPARVASTENVTIASPGATIDGVTLASGDRVLLKNQTAGAENGIYAWTGATTAMTRTSDADAVAELLVAIVLVTQGTVNRDTIWQQTADAITLGTTAITWAPMGGSLASVAAGSVFRIPWNGSAWTYSGVALTARPSARTDIFFDLWGAPAATASPDWALDGDSRTDAAKLFPGTWNEGSTYGNWHVDYNGYGTVQQLSDGTIRMQPQWVAAGDTSACLVSSTSTYTGDVTITAQMRTIQQRPTGTNPWETAWLFWGFTTKIGTPSQGIPDPNNVIEKAYYIALKPNGWELGKLDQENFTATGGQRYLTSDTTPTYPVDDTWHQVRITMTGATITATVDGTQLATFTDGPGSAGYPAWSTNETVYTSGSVCLYCEDSLVEFRNVTVTPNGSATQTWL